MTTLPDLPNPGRYAAVDVHYRPEGGAVAAVFVTADPEFSKPVEGLTMRLRRVAPYRPGEFYRRELPAIRAVLRDVAPVDLLVVDGYVQLDPDGRPGLGAYAHKEFKVPVIGVAKNPFRTATHAIEVRRGTVRRPLYVTAAGIDPQRAAELVRRMAGRYRIPDALKRVDTSARTAEADAHRRLAEAEQAARRDREPS